MAEREVTATEIWEKYQRGANWHTKQQLHTKTDKCHWFYEGDQWRDADGAIADNLPKHNFIRSIVDYKTAMIAQSGMKIIYNPIRNAEEHNQVCKLLNGYADKKWERQKMDTRLWEIVKEAIITGDSFLYFCDDELNNQMLLTDQVFLGDEQEQDIQRQPYILLQERQLVSAVREEARKNGLDEDEVMQIVPDSNGYDLQSQTDEVKGPENEKCTTLLYLTKENGELQFCRSTQTVVYQPMQTVTGMHRYPIAKFTWLKKHRSSRGVGEVWDMISNQVETNKTLYRRLQSIKASAFPKPVYVEGAIRNPENITAVGTPVRVQGNVQRLSEVFTYLQPAAISGDAKIVQDELMETTRELASAGDNAMGNINPEQASGAAIVAVQDAQAVPLNEHKAAARQFVEDIALIWRDMFIAYGVNGVEVEGAMLKSEMLDGVEMEVRIDVSDGSPYSKYAREQALENVLAAGYITFEEYVTALDDDAHAPKAKFQQILKARKGLPEETPDEVLDEVLETGVDQMQEIPAELVGVM